MAVTEENENTLELFEVNLECLCQFMIIVGKTMDTEKAQKLMDQYFQRLGRILSRTRPETRDPSMVNGCGQKPMRISACGVNTTMPKDGLVISTRTRFMIEDIIALRANSWVPTRAGQRLDSDKPRFLKDIRFQLAKDSGTSIAPTPSERSSYSRDVPGSGYDQALSNNSSGKTIPFFNNQPIGRGGRSGPSHPSDYDAKDWFALSRLGDELCKPKHQTLNMFNRSNPASTNGFSRNDNRRVRQVEEPDPRFIGGADRRDSDKGWPRGGGSNKRASASNLPPRLLRKMAAEQQQQLAPLEHSSPPPMPSIDRSTPSDATSSTSGRSSGYSSVVDPNSASVTCETFEPTYIQKTASNECVFSLRPNTAKNCRSPTVASEVDTHNEQQRWNHGAKNKDDHSIESNARIKSPFSPSKASDVRLQNSPNSRPAVVEGNIKIVNHLVSLFNQVKDADELIRSIQRFDQIGKITTEVIASVVLRLCDESFASSDGNCEWPGIRLANLASKSLETIGWVESTHSILGPVWRLVDAKLTGSGCLLSKSKIAAFLAASIWTDRLELRGVIESLYGAKHHPLFLLVLQQLDRLAVDYSGHGDSISDRRQWLNSLVESTGVCMHRMVPDSYQAPDRLYELLDDRGLIFLVPRLTLSVKLLSLVPLVSTFAESEINDSAIVECLLTPVSLDETQSTSFIHALLPATLSHVYNAGLALSNDSLMTPEQCMAREHAAWECWSDKLLKVILTGAPDRQLACIHALQLFWYNAGKPKGFLVRCFMNLYNCDLVEERTFMDWKEELNPNYPSKGDALFEVNRWLTWLETAEEEEDEVSPQVLPDSTLDVTNRGRSNSTSLDQVLRLVADLPPAPSSSNGTQLNA